VPATSRWKRKSPPLRLEDLRGADLKGKDLTRRKGLLPQHLAGADLTGAKLPDHVTEFPALHQVTAISSDARKIFVGLLAACVYSWLVIGTTKDVQLIVNTATSPLPIINTPIPIAGFYVVGAALLAAVYCWLHFYLHRLWRVLGTLPAVFPDGMSLDDKSDPWPLTSLVRVYFQRLKPNAHPLKQLETWLSIALAWGLVPLTLVALWARYLPSHNWLGTYGLVILSGSTAVYGWHFFRFARAALRGEASPSDRPFFRGTWRELRSLTWAGRTFFALVAFALPLFLIGCSIAAFHTNPHDSSWAARGLMGLRLLGIRTYADLREVNVAEPPDGWDGRDWSKVKRVDLRGRNLAFAQAESAFLANADLRGANLTSANLSTAQLQGADLTGAQLQGAALWNAQLQGADLFFAKLQGAFLLEAQLQGADLRAADLQGAFLEHTQLQGADLDNAELQGAGLRNAQLQGADLGRAQLQGAELVYAQLQGADLGRAQLQGAELVYAQLQGADLGYAQLQGADLDEAQLQGTNLRGAALWRAFVPSAQWDYGDLRGANVQPMNDSDITALVIEATDGIPEEITSASSVRLSLADPERRKEVAERLNAALRTAELPARPNFPEEWRSEPNVMFDRNDPRPEPFNWGRPNWATEEAYDEDLATFLGDLACASTAPEALTRGLTRRTLLGSFSEDRKWHKLFAARLLGPNWPRAKSLPDDVREDLEALRDDPEALRDDLEAPRRADFLR
jgi:uncharacterized protein YjbI with pentapeptide repeats